MLFDFQISIIKGILARECLFIEKRQDYYITENNIICKDLNILNNVFTKRRIYVKILR